MPLGCPPRSRSAGSTRPATTPGPPSWPFAASSARRGDVVSPQGWPMTVIAAFGEPLTPQQVVERIPRATCPRRGLAAVLEHTRRSSTASSFRPDPGPRLGRGAARGSHSKADPAYLKTIRRVRDNVMSRSRPASSTATPRCDGAAAASYSSAIGRCGGSGSASGGRRRIRRRALLMTAVPGAGGGGRGDRRRRAADEVRRMATPTSPRCQGARGDGGLPGSAGSTGAAARWPMASRGLSVSTRSSGPATCSAALAKRRVYGEVDIDSIAGPSEVVLIADWTAGPEVSSRPT